MATYTWNGGSGVWTTAASWTVDGSTPATAPGSTDDVLIAAAGAYTVTVSTSAVASLTVTDPSATVVVGATLAIATDIATGGIANSGTIKVATGATLNEGPTDISGGPSANLFSNTGTLMVASTATLSLNATTTTAGLGAIINNGGSVTLDLALDNTGATFTPADYGPATIIGSFTGGIIAAGTAGASFGISPLAFANLTFDAVTIDGAATLLSSGAITGGITLRGADGTGPGNLVIVALSTLDGPITLDDATITLDSLSLLGDGGALGITDQAVFAPGFTLNAADDDSSGAISGAGTLLNQGSIEVHNQLDVTAAAFTNTGVAATGTNFVFIGMLSRPLPGTTTFNTADGFITNSGTILSGGGNVIFRGAVVGDGLIAISASTTIDGTVELAGGYDQQVFRFLDASASTLKLDAPAGVNALQGFTPGNTIELVGINASVVFNDTTLSIESGGTTIAGFVLPGVPNGTPFSAVSDGDGNTIITELPCFAAGTHVLTPSGETPVEDLRPGDPVVSAFGRTVPVQWVGRRHVAAFRHPQPAMIWPIRVRAGALADGVPARDLWLSPEHAVYLTGLLIPVKLLVNGRTIVQEPCTAITYFHVELPRHDMILAEGTPCESYLDTGNRADFDNAGAVIAAQPVFTGRSANEIWQARACAPQCRSGERLDAIRRTLDQRRLQFHETTFMDGEHRPKYQRKSNR